MGETAVKRKPVIIQHLQNLREKWRGLSWGVRLAIKASVIFGTYGGFVLLNPEEYDSWEKVVGGIGVVCMLAYQFTFDDISKDVKDKCRKMMQGPDKGKPVDIVLNEYMIRGDKEGFERVVRQSSNMIDDRSNLEDFNRYQNGYIQRTGKSIQTFYDKWNDLLPITKFKEKYIPQFTNIINEKKPRTLNSPSYQSTVHGFETEIEHLYYINNKGDICLVETSEWHNLDGTNYNPDGIGKYKSSGVEFIVEANGITKESILKNQRYNGNINNWFIDPNQGLDNWIKVHIGDKILTLKENKIKISRISNINEIRFTIYKSTLDEISCLRSEINAYLEAQMELNPGYHFYLEEVA